MKVLCLNIVNPPLDLGKYHYEKVLTMFKCFIFQFLKDIHVFKG